MRLDGLKLTIFFTSKVHSHSFIHSNRIFFVSLAAFCVKRKFETTTKKNREKNCKFYCQLFYYSSFIHNNLFYSEKFWRYVLQFISALRHNVEMITIYSVDDSFKQRFSCMIIFYVRFFVCFYCVARQMVTFKMTISFILYSTTLWFVCILRNILKINCATKNKTNKQMKWREIIRYFFMGFTVIWRIVVMIINPIYGCYCSTQW